MKKLLLYYGLLCAWQRCYSEGCFWCFASRQVVNTLAMLSEWIKAVVMSLVLPTRSLPVVLEWRGPGLTISGLWPECHICLTPLNMRFYLYCSSSTSHPTNLLQRLKVKSSLSVCRHGIYACDRSWSNLVKTSLATAACVLHASTDSLHCFEKGNPGH